MGSLDMRINRKGTPKLLAALLLLMGMCQVRAQFLYWDYINMVTDTVQSGAYADMKIGPDGKIHISFWQRVEDKLVYAWKAPNDTVWHREYVDPTHQNGFRSSVCLDQTGTPHVAYYENVNGNVGVRYARRIGASNWTTETLPDIYGRGYGDYGPLGTVSSKERVQHSLELIFDENNKPQIAFFDGWMLVDAFPSCTANSQYGFKLHQGIRVNNQWLVRSLGQVVDQDSSCGEFLNRFPLPHGDRYGEYLDMLLEPDGTMDIFSQARFNNNLLRHRTLFPYVDTVWVQTVVDSLDHLLPNWTVGWPSFTRFYTIEGISATQTADQNIHLAYTSSIFYGENFCCTSLTNDLVYTRLSPAGIPSYHQFGTSTNRNYTDIATRGGSDSIFILYADLSNLSFILAESADSGNTWSGDTLLTGIAIGKCQVEIYGDTIYALVFDSQRERLLLFKRNVIGGNWVIDEVTFSQSRGQSMDAVFSVIGNDTIVRVAFNDGYTGKLYFSQGTKVTNWNWSIQQLDTNASDVIAVSMAKTSTDQPVVAYNGGPGRDLRIASHATGSWVYEIIDPGGNPQYTDIAISSNDSMYVVYYDGSQNCLHRATRHVNGGPWVLEDITCDTTAVGLHPSIVLDGNGLPHITYYNDNDRSLYYAKLNGTTRQWETDSVNGGSSSAIGKYNSLLLDASGMPKIAYLNEQDDAVLLSEMLQPGSWVHTTVDSQSISNIGRPIDMQLDPFGKLWIAYNYFGNFERTKLMHRDGSIWREVGVNSTGHIANEFNFKIMGGDLFLIGKKNEIQNTGIAMLYANNGVFVEANEAALLSHNVKIQNHPNPFSSFTTFRLEVEVPAFLSLEIMDLTGKKIVKVFQAQRIGSGTHDFIFDASSLAPGIYLYELRSATGRTVQKMVLTR